MIYNKLTLNNNLITKTQIIKMKRISQFIFNFLFIYLITRCNDG